jgi:perosamine synthetase
MEGYNILGYNYRMTDIQASIGLRQLDRLKNILESRMRLDKIYRKNFRDIENVELPYKPDWAKTNWQSYPVRLTGRLAGRRDHLCKILYQHSIASLPGISNAHSLNHYRKSGFSLPESDRAEKEVILLPFYAGLKEADVRNISEIVRHWSRQ